MFRLDQLPDTLNWNRRKRKQRQVYTGPSSIKPVDVWFDLLSNHPSFENLLGYTRQEEIPHVNGEVETVTTKYTTRCIPSNYWKFHHKESGHGCVLNFERTFKLTNRIFLKCIFVEEEHSKKGIATACLRELQQITDQVDGLSRNKEKYQNKLINGNYCVLSLCPNAFYVENWTYQDDRDIDWSNTTHPPDINMKDNASGDMDAALIRMNDEELKQYYLKQGFVDCPYLDFHYYFNDKHNCISRVQLLTDYSISINRHSMIYPATNLKYFDEKKRSGESGRRDDLKTLIK